MKAYDHKIEIDEEKHRSKKDNLKAGDHNIDTEKSDNKSMADDCDADSEMNWYERATDSCESDEPAAG